jgi:hypothetical protein
MAQIFSGQCRILYAPVYGYFLIIPDDASLVLGVVKIAALIEEFG